MNLTEQVKQSTIGSKVHVKYPFGDSYRTIHRKPAYKQNDVYVTISRSEYKIIGFKTVGILKVFEVEFRKGGKVK